MLCPSRRVKILWPSSGGVVVKYALPYSGRVVLKYALFFRQGDGETCSVLLAGW